MEKSKRRLKQKITVAMAFFIILSMGLIAQTFRRAIIEGPEYKRRAASEQTTDNVISAKRGTIYDRNRNQLATSASVERVVLDPAKIKDATEVATKISQLLGISYDTVYQRATKKNSEYELLKNRLEKDMADQVRALELTGVRLVPDSKRYYPYGAFLSNVLGFTGDDNQGIEGLEKFYDAELAGTPGRLRALKDTGNADMPFEYEEYFDPKPGYDMYLTIDEVIQHFVEKHLGTAVVENKLAAGAAAIAMNPKTGEVLAMSTMPNYDLNNPREITDTVFLDSIKDLPTEEYNARQSQYLLQRWRNKAVVDTYEPGSTFKIVTAAMALEENMVKEDDTFVCNGSRAVGGRDIGCHKVTGHGTQTFVQGVQNSCNPVFMDIAERVGRSSFHRYTLAFGFKQKTGFDLPGEAEGILYSEAALNPVELATSSFGQGFQVTPLQLISAVSAVANSGMLMKPYIVSHFTDHEGNIVKKTEPTQVRQIVSKDTADQLRTILESVVSEGTGSNAYVKGYRVAGKTGTSEKAPRGTDKRIASFVGFAPADDPQIAILVMLDEPNVAIKYGGTIAAPVVRSIMEDSLRYLGVVPRYTPEEEKTIDINVPGTIGILVEQAKERLESTGFKTKVIGNGEMVTDQMPQPSATLAKDGTVLLYTEGIDNVSPIRVPSVINQTAQTANQTIVNSGFNFKIAGGQLGRGMAIKQDPPPDTLAMPGSVISVEFRVQVTDDN